MRAPTRCRGTTAASPSEITDAQPRCCGTATTPPRETYSRAKRACAGAPRQPRASPQRVSSMAGEHILIGDDEPAIRSTLRGVLEDEGYRVSAVGGGADALKFFADEQPEVTFLDIWMDRMDGLETLAEVKRARPEAVVVMISGHGTIETAVKATRLGAYDFIEKPLSLEKILVTVSRALEHARLERENASLPPT